MEITLLRPGGRPHIHGAPEKGMTVQSWTPSGANMPRIRLKKPRSFLIVDDHATVRRGLRQVVAVATQLKSNMRLAAHRAGDVGAVASEDHTKGDS